MLIDSFARGCVAASVCWLVAAVPAQSTAESRPVAPARARAVTPPTAPNAEDARLRLAEVMAMLEEDQLTPEQRRRALAKLAEVQAQLRTPSQAPSAPSVKWDSAKSIQAEGQKPPVPAADDTNYRRWDAEGSPPVIVEGTHAERPRQLRTQPPTPPAPPASPAPPAPPAKWFPAKVIQVEGQEVLVPAVIDAKAVYGSKDAEIGRRVMVEGKEGAKIYLLKEMEGAPIGKLQGSRIMTVPETEVPVSGAEVETRLQQAKELRVQALRLEEQASKAKESLQLQLVRARDQAVRARDQAVRALEVTPRWVESRAGVPSGVSSSRAMEVEVPSRAAKPRAAAQPAAAKDTEIQAIVEQMRAEMRELRAVLEELRGKVNQDEPAPVVLRPARAGR